MRQCVLDVDRAAQSLHVRGTVGTRDPLPARIGPPVHLQIHVLAVRCWTSCCLSIDRSYRRAQIKARVRRAGATSGRGRRASFTETTGDRDGVWAILGIVKGGLVKSNVIVIIVAISLCYHARQLQGLGSDGLGGRAMEIDQVETFLAVVMYGGFHRAAEALHVSQPAVSGRIRALEDR